MKFFLFRFLTFFWLSSLISCHSHQRIEVNLDCQKTNLIFQCQVSGLHLYEEDKYAETYFTSQPSQVPNNIRVVNSSIFFVPSSFFTTFTDIKEFVANNCSISEIYHETLIGASKLQYLALSFNNIKIIPDYTFRNNSELQTLKLDHNEIQRLTTDAFRGLFTLRLLQLSFNKIKYLPLYLFHDLESLETLELNNNMIEVISSGQFVTNKQLTFIDLHNNAISIIDNDAFDDVLSTIQQVDLNHNTCVDGDFKHTEKNLMKLIECCSTSLEEKKSCLASRQEQEESGSGAWAFVIVFIILGNVSLVVYIVLKRINYLSFLRNREDHIELTGNVVLESGSSHQWSY